LSGENPRGNEKHQRNEIIGLGIQRHVRRLYLKWAQRGARDLFGTCSQWWHRSGKAVLCCRSSSELTHLPETDLMRFGHLD
jgi:hypothetical protein